MISEQLLNKFLNDPKNFDISKIDKSFVGSLFNILALSRKNYSNKILLKNNNIQCIDIVKFVFEKLPKQHFNFFLEKLKHNLNFKSFSYNDIYSYLKEWNKINNNFIIHQSLFCSSIEKNLFEDSLFYADILIKEDYSSFFNILKNFLTIKKINQYNIHIFYELIKKLKIQLEESYFLFFHFLEKSKLLIRRIELDIDYHNEFVNYLKQNISIDNSGFLNFITHKKFLKINVNHSFFLNFLDIVKYDLTSKQLSLIICNPFFNKYVENSIYLYKIIISTEIEDNINILTYNLFKSDLYDDATKELIKITINLENF